jgi:hypothetical protein
MSAVMELKSLLDELSAGAEAGAGVAGAFPCRTIKLSKAIEFIRVVVATTVRKRQTRRVEATQTRLSSLYIMSKTRFLKHG